MLSLIMKNKYLKIIISFLLIIVAILTYIIIDMARDDTWEPKGEFKATTPEGKLREISNQVKNR
ncbi:MAG: hypothetical protein U9N52_01950 [Campylobacterota bacterium]|nr:hypothetical protein [Campylobacterota bacterium]